MMTLKEECILGQKHLWKRPTHALPSMMLWCGLGQIISLLWALVSSSAFSEKWGLKGWEWEIEILFNKMLWWAGCALLQVSPCCMEEQFPSCAKFWSTPLCKAAVCHEWLHLENKCHGRMPLHFVYTSKWPPAAWHHHQTQTDEWINCANKERPPADLLN